MCLLECMKSKYNTKSQYIHYLNLSSYFTVMLHMLLSYAGHFYIWWLKIQISVVSILNLINCLHCRSLHRVPPFAWAAILYLRQTWMVRIYFYILLSGSCFLRFLSIVCLHLLFPTNFFSWLHFPCLPVFFFFQVKCTYCVMYLQRCNRKLHLLGPPFLFHRLTPLSPLGFLLLNWKGVAPWKTLLCIFLSRTSPQNRS